MSTAQPLRSGVFGGSARAINARASDGLSSGTSGAGSRLAQLASNAANHRVQIPALRLPTWTMPGWRARLCRCGITSVPSLREDKDLSMDESLLNRLKRFDEARPSFPAEHWLAFGAAIWLLTRPSASPFGRLLSVASGLALVYRAASGRDGL